MGQAPDHVLDRPSTDDRDQFFTIDSDPRVWTHLPSRLGLELVHRAPDAGNPDPTAVRLVFADRDLTAAQLEATLA